MVQQEMLQILRDSPGKWLSSTAMMHKLDVTRPSCIRGLNKLANSYTLILKRSSLDCKGSRKYEYLYMKEFEQ